MKKFLFEIDFLLIFFFFFFPKKRLIPLEEDKKKPGETEMVPIKEENNQLPVGHPSIKK
jgi:hypothetical protein